MSATKEVGDSIRSIQDSIHKNISSMDEAVKRAGEAADMARRSGGSAALDGLYHYLAYAEMLLATSNYWNIAHGSSPGELSGDAEGLQIVELLAGNLAWLLKMRELSRSSLPEPPAVAKVRTNFVR